MTATTMGVLRGFGSEKQATGKTRTSTERLHIALTPRMMERLEYLKEKTEAASAAEVIRNAMRLYDTLIQEIEDGNEIFVRTKDGNFISYKAII